jgi:predicted RNase H-like HicB family nuclease
MKTVDYYMSLPYKIELYPDIEEGGYAIACPELPGCISCGETIEECIESIEDAKHEWITACLEDGYEIPEPKNKENYSGQFKIRMPKSLHKKLAEQSKAEGISMNQYCIYLLSMNSAYKSKEKVV